MVRRLSAIGLLLVLGCGEDNGVGLAPASSDLTTMNVGEVRVFNAANVWDGFYLPPATSAREFILIVANTNPRPDVVEGYIVQADKLTGGSLDISAASQRNVQQGAFGAASVGRGARQQALDSKLRFLERSGLTLRSPGMPVGGSMFSPRYSRQSATRSLPEPGDVLDLKIPDATSSDLCVNYSWTKAVVASVTRRAILAVDTIDGPPSSLFSQAVLDSIAQEFDNVTYPTDSSYFGNPTDVDGNGHIIIVFSGRINMITAPGQNDFVGGFFFAGDFFPTSGTEPKTFCPQSNGAEIFYLLSPDPTGKFGNVRTTSSVRQVTRGTIAHEFQHMINAGNRYLNPAVTTFEARWLDEALAHFAEDAVGRAQRHFGDLETLTLADLVPPGDAQANNDFNSFFYENFARLSFWMERPDTSSGISAGADVNLSSRGAAWAILRYSADNYSNGDPRALTRKLAAGPDTGVLNFTLSTGVPIDTLVSGWLVSMYADHLGIPGLDAKYQYRSYNFRDIMPPVARVVLGLQTATYPLRVIPIGSGRDTISSINQSGTGTYYSLNSGAGGGEVTVKIVGATPVAFLDCCIQRNEDWRTRFAYPGAHVYVLRTQ
jgi:hypothetical protein